MNYYWRKLLFNLGFTLKANCGHYTKRKVIGKIGDAEFVTNLTIAKDGKVPICGKCLVDLGIQCAWCGLPILLGDAVTTFEPKDGYVPPPLCRKKGKSLVGCSRPTCLRSKADIVGNLMPYDNFKVADVHFTDPTALLFITLDSMDIDILIDNLEDVAGVTIKKPKDEPTSYKIKKHELN